MITLVLTNRNRDIRIIKNCLDSLQNQSDIDFEWFLVDYGSNETYLNELNALVLQYPQIQFISCPTSGQLWSKCRSINIALQKATQPYFVVGDIDLIFHPNYIQTLKSVANLNTVHYFQYGFLSETESVKKQSFEDFKVDFKGGKDVTGNTMFPTAVLKSVNGFDEFYQGWGAEDTDAHIRMQNLGLQVVFYEEQILVKHQWHPKAYRSKKSTHPYHSQLERINHAYMIQTQNNKRTVVNQYQNWGQLTHDADYQKLQFPEKKIIVSSSSLQVNALLAQLKNFKNEVIQVEIHDLSKAEKNKNRIKRILGKKALPFYEMEYVNNLVLEEIIKNYRNYPYHYSFNRQTNTIVLVINFVA